MASNKKLLKTLRGDMQETPPIWLMRQAGRYLPEYRATRAQTSGVLDLCYAPELACEVTLQPRRRFDLDAAILFADILLICDALGQGVRFAEGEGPILEPRMTRDRLGDLSLSGINDHLAPVYKTVELLKKNLPEHIALIGFAGAPWTVATYMVEGGGSKTHALTRYWACDDPEGF